MNIGVDADCIPICTEVSVVSVDKLLSVMKSGLGLDIAKNHSGITIWENGGITRYGFSLDEYDKLDPHADYRMRLSLKENLKKYIAGKSFEYCIVEDIYGGENFDTVRKLIVLNTVIDELIFEGTITVTNFYRWKEPVWLKYFRRIYKIKGSPKSKIETQRILEYMNDDFYMQNKDLSESAKKKIFFEDICDSTAMLCAVAMYINGGMYDEKRDNLKISDIQMYYIEYEDYYLTVEDDRVRLEQYVYVDSKFKNLENKILSEVKAHPNEVICMDLPVKKLGSFGIKHKFPFYTSGEGVLLFYRKD